MKQFLLLTITLFSLKSVAFAQNQPPLNPEENRWVLEQLNNLRESTVKVRELEVLLKASEGQIDAKSNELANTRALLLIEKKERLATMAALAEYRATRRSWFVKNIACIGGLLCGDKRDRLLDAQMAELSDEIREWK